MWSYFSHSTDVKSSWDSMLNVYRPKWQLNRYLLFSLWMKINTILLWLGIMNINLEKEMATHLGKFTYAWESQGQRSLVGCRLLGRAVGHDWSDLAAAAAGKILLEKPGRLQSMELQRVGYNSTSTPPTSMNIGVLHLIVLHLLNKNVNVRI